jgi:hypothetical protein
MLLAEELNQNHVPNSHIYALKKPLRREGALLYLFFACKFLGFFLRRLLGKLQAIV